MSLRVRDLSFSYGPKQALDKVSFSVEAGQFCALLGPNGAGKSTLFALLTRLFTANGGEIMIAGHNLRDAPRKALRHMGIVFQQSTLDLDLTVRQNLRYFAALHGISGRDASMRIDASLERLNMLERADEKSRALNGGHRRRAEIARALIHNPMILLLDEPTVGLDAAARKSITDHVHELGITTLWATHLTDEIGPDDHLLVLHQGKILRDAPTGEIAGDGQIADAFLAMTS